MKQVAKLIVINPNNEYLLLFRDNHPVFGDDPDIPGGTAEEQESPAQAMIREVREEIGVSINVDDAKQIYSGINDQDPDTLCVLFVTHLSSSINIKLSWEHSSYEWLSYSDFIKEIKFAKDTFMHMAYGALS